MTAPGTPGPSAEPRPRLGFVGLGWIGGARLRAVAASGAADIVALCDVDEALLAEWGATYPAASLHRDVESLLEGADEAGLDGVVLATPNALHADQARAGLENGLALFVQKPLGLDAGEVARIVAAARSADRLVDVDYSYRHLDGAQKLREHVRAGRLGEIHLVEAVFHNAYGPDKAWCFDPAMSGGGALLDLGVHLVDLVSWLLGPSTPRLLHARLHDLPGSPGIDRFASADLALDRGTHLRLTCSWHAHAGRDCEFGVTLHGSEGGAALRNRDGGFYDFELVLRRGRSEEVVASDARVWMDRGILSWIERVRAGGRYDAGLETSLTVARIVDAIHATGRPRERPVGAAPADHAAAGATL